MGFVEGRPVDDTDALRADGHDLPGLLQVAVRAWLEGVLVHGFFHGDVHAGNLFVTPDGKVAFLDFGITGRLDEGVRLVLRDALPAVLIERDFSRVVDAFFALGAAAGPIDAAAAAADVEALALPLLSRPLGEIAYGEILAQVLRVATRHKVRLPRELVLVVKQILYFERYAKEMAPDYQILADPALIPLVLGEPAAPPGGAADATAVAEVLRLPRPASRALDPPASGLLVPSLRDATFAFDYDSSRPQLRTLYQRAKRSQWNATTDLDWSIEVDPYDSGGMADYLPLVAADAFARFSDRERADATREFNAWIISQFLHGEQGALLATSKLVQQVPDADAKLYGATQVIDEARHVEVYARYLDTKLELTYPVNPNLRELLELVVADPRWDVTYLGMQVVVEGLALAAFGLIHQFSDEPLVKQITRYVMADEARHVAFGTLSLTGLYEEMTDSERRDREDFVVEAASLMRDRFLAEEVWERLGIPATDGLRASAATPMLQLFQRVLFAKITPTLTRIGLHTPRLRDQLIAVGAIAAGP